MSLYMTTGYVQATASEHEGITDMFGRQCCCWECQAILHIAGHLSIHLSLHITIGPYVSEYMIYERV